MNIFHLEIMQIIEEQIRELQKIRRTELINKICYIRVTRTKAIELLKELEANGNIHQTRDYVEYLKGYFD